MLPLHSVVGWLRRAVTEDDMESREIVAIITRRRDFFVGSRTIGSANDPLSSAAAEIARAISDEYESLLVEIGAIKSYHRKSA